MHFISYLQYEFAILTLFFKPWFCFFGETEQGIFMFQHRIILYKNAY